MNLRKFAVSLSMLSLVAVASAMQAKADPVVLVNGGSGVTFTYQSVTFPDSHASALFTLNGNTLTVQLNNTSTEPGDGTLLTALGFNTTPDLKITNYLATGAAAGWTLNQGALGVFEVSANGQGAGEAILQGGSSTLTFTFSNSLTQLTIDLTTVHLQSLGDGDGGSEKPPGTTTPTPEPATMLLLGTGLAGLASGIRRRRNKQI